MSKIKKKTIETLPDGSKIVTIEYEPEHFYSESAYELEALRLRGRNTHPCAFDGLEPGVYGLVCTCPRCSPRCTATFIT